MKRDGACPTDRIDVLGARLAAGNYGSKPRRAGRIAGRPDRVAEVYAIVAKQDIKTASTAELEAEIARRKYEAVACFRNAVNEAPESISTEARLRAARAAMLSRFEVADLGDEYERTHARPVTEAHHAAEAMRMPVTSAKLDGGTVPSALVCSARLP